MSFDVNAAARQLGVDPSKITASADGSTYTVTANGVTKTYKASGDGENSVFTEQAAQTSGSGTPAAPSSSGGNPGSITVDQSIWAQNMSALTSNLQADLFMNSGLMSGMPGATDNSGGLFQIIQNLMNAIKIQMPTMPTIQPVIPPVVVDGSGSGSGVGSAGNAGGAGSTGGAGNETKTKEQLAKEKGLIAGNGSGAWNFKGVYYKDTDGNGVLNQNDSHADGKCYVWDEESHDFIEYTRISSGKYQTANGDTYELKISKSGNVTSASFKKVSEDSSSNNKDNSKAASDICLDVFDSIDGWGTKNEKLKDTVGYHEVSSPAYPFSSNKAAVNGKLNKDNIMAVLDKWDSEYSEKGSFFKAVCDDTDDDIDGALKYAQQMFDVLVAHAKEKGVDANSFIAKFNAEVKNSYMYVSFDTLEEIFENLRSAIKSKESAS